MLSFANMSGNLFNRLGKLGLTIKQAKSYQTSQQPNFIDTTNGVVAQYNGESDIQALMGSAYIGQLNGVTGVGGLMQSIAQSTINRMVFRDNPQIAQTLTQLNVITSIYEVIRQMKIEGASILAMTITSAPIVVSQQPGPHFTGVGDGVIVCSTKRPVDGLVLENTFTEKVLFTCTQDSYLGGATAGNEGFTLTGTGAETSVFAFDWPLGSGATTSLNAIDGNTSNGSGNILTNSGFTTWTTTANVPNNWHLTVGTAGTNTFQETSIVFGTGSALRITGDGSSTLTSLQQQFGVDTAGTLDPLTQYSFNVWMRRDGTAAGAGTLTIDWVDGNGVVVLDQNGVANSFTIDLTALTTVYTAYNGVFRTPGIMPSAIYQRMRLSVALTNGRSVYLDDASLGEMTQLGVGLPFYAVHSGNIPFFQGDYGSVQNTNSRGSGGTLSTFQTLLYQLYPDVAGNEILFPSSSVPTISDNLIS